ncbi:MAG: iron ABC transporter permease, partial [Paracoccaceae bacterium]|nr:iron ABC transporter permease [Paracoccaceae bacterium]
MTTGFAAVAVLVTIICVIPYIGVLAAAVSGSFDTLSHLAETVLGRYTVTTIVLVVLVMTGSAVIGAGAAWLVTMTEFPGRRWMEIALALPLAFPALSLIHIS